MRKITIEKIESATVVTIEKDGRTQKKATSKSRDVRPVYGGVKIMPEKNETQFNNMIIKLEELTDNFGATTSNELIEVFAEKGFFFENKVSGDSNENEGCFHLNGNTLHMCNVYTVFNSRSLGLGSEMGNRIVIFFELPEIKYGNLRATFQIGSTKLYNSFSRQQTNIPPLRIDLNTSFYNGIEWSNISRKLTFKQHVGYSKVNVDVENFPGNYLLKLTSQDGLNNPNQLLNTIENNYEHDAPVEAEAVITADDKKGVLIYLPKDYQASIENSFFVNLSSFELTFQDEINETIYREFPKASFYEGFSLPRFETIEASKILNGQDDILMM